MKLSHLLLLLIFLPLPAYAAPQVKIIDWQETTKLTKTGKSAKVLIQGKVQDALPNQAITAFSIGFDKRQNIKINKVASDAKLTEFTFSNNVLSVKFPKAKGNEEPISVFFTYDEKYDRVDEYLRQEIIYIPAFAAGAKASVIINFPGELESATLNPNVTKNGNAFIYRNIVPKEGVEEIIKLTPAQSIWDVKVKVKISSDQSLNNMTVLLPTYFQSPIQKVENFNITTSINPVTQNISNGKKVFNFNTKEKEILIENKARISTGKDNRGQSSRNPGQYIKYSAEEYALLSPILEQIKQNPKYKDLPLYAKIGGHVHEYIKYDDSYLGKLVPLKEILQKPIGVCTEYATLYNALARVAGIPSVIINGGACGEYDECQGHAWNSIFYNNQWIDVDPTWDLMSGIVSSSHIYFNDEGAGDVETRYFNRGSTVKSKLDFEMKRER